MKEITERVQAVLKLHEFRAYCTKIKDICENSCKSMVKKSGDIKKAISSTKCSVEICCTNYVGESRRTAKQIM